MIEATLDIATKNGAMETFLCHPERGGPFPAVMLLMDAPGIREELRDMARRLRLDFRAGRLGERQRRAGPDAGDPHQDDDPAGDGRYRRDARLYRFPGRAAERPGRRARLLHERALCAGRRFALPRPDRGGGLVL